jgi:hypothetical protein
MSDTISEYQRSIDEFKLEPLVPKKKKRYLPDNVIGMELATPHEQIVTVIVLVKGKKGAIIRVPVGWAPSTKTLKRMSDETWAKLGIEKHTQRIRTSAIRMAKSEHGRMIQKYGTIDMFDEEKT